MSIDEFINIVAPKLPLYDVKRITEPMSGADLKLTGYKEFNGQPIEDDKIYDLPVPVYGKKHNHRHKMCLAWLRGGANAVAAYMRKFMKAEDVEKAISVLKAKTK